MNDVFAAATTPARSGKRVVSLALTAAFLAAGSLAAMAEDCVLNSVEKLPALAVGGAGHAARLKLLRTADGTAAPVLMDCSDGFLSKLEIHLEPGQRRLIKLVAESGVLMPINVWVEEDNKPAAGRWQIELKAMRADPSGELYPIHFASDAAPLTQVVQIDITADTSNLPGQRQVMRIGGSNTSGKDGLLLVIEDGREERMFRDQFRIDPTLGQFSQRASSRSGPDGTPAPANGSAGL